MGFSPKEFASFEKYITSSDMTPEAVQKLISLAQGFLQNISNKDMKPETINQLYPDKNEVFCAMAWLMMYQAFQNNKPLHKGMFLLDVGTKEVNIKCFEYFRQAGISRPSSHFNRKMDKKFGSYGITLDSKHRLPGPIKKAEGLEQLTTGLFMILDEPKGRLALKYEDFPFDLLRHPIGTIKHTITWIGGKKINTPEVVGRREDALPENIIKLLEIYVEKTSPVAIERYSKKRIKNLNTTIRIIRENLKENPSSAILKKQLAAARDERNFGKRSLDKKIALGKKLQEINISSKSPEDKLEAKRKLMHEAFGYSDDIAFWLRYDLSTQSNDVINAIQKLLPQEGTVYGSEVSVSFSGREAPIVIPGVERKSFNPDGPISGHAITWNMGNKAASKSVVDHFYKQLASKPTVIAISTQEELAATGERLQDKLLAKLNEHGEEYELVETVDPQYHTTMAGANNSPVTLAKALLTSENRVSSAVLVKKPFKLEGAKAIIDYEPGKEKGNKSIITIKGTLTTKGGRPFPISVSGGHLDSNSDQKRRAHANAFLEHQGMKSDKPKNYDEILLEAKTLRIMMGDFNERNYLMSDGNPKDKTHQTNYVAYGFDMALKPMMKIGTKNIDGTYGFGIDGKPSSSPDPRNRQHVTKGGDLDKIGIVSGLSVQSNQYGAQLDEKGFTVSEKGKGYYEGSDHLPVIRSFTVTPPKEGQELQIVAEYVKKRLPDFQKELDELNSLLDPDTKSIMILQERAKSLRFHDSTTAINRFLKSYAGVKEDATITDIIDALKAKRIQKEQMIAGVKKIEKSIITIASEPSEQGKETLTKIFNAITKCNELRNAMFALPNSNVKVVPQQDYNLFKQYAREFVDLAYSHALDGLHNSPSNNADNIKEISRKIDELARQYPTAFESFNDAKDQILKQFNITLRKQITSQLESMQRSRRRSWSAELSPSSLPAFDKKEKSKPK